MRPVSLPTAPPAAIPTRPPVEILVNTPALPGPGAFPDESFVIYDQVGGKIKTTVRRPGIAEVICEWDPQPLAWKIRGQWTRGQLEGEEDYKIQLRQNLTEISYKVIEHALRAYPQAETLRLRAITEAKLPPEIAAYPSRVLLTMRISRSTVNRLGWKSLNDLFPPKELIEEYQYQEYLRLFQD
ncbi:MAG: hypothetical protein FJZ01_03640 [Candidatus Sericytochromatia bacterium]|nr:hypothetical protein [Candidatus Tanganyikabacteria bacterium]